MRDHKVLSNTVRELEWLHIGTQLGRSEPFVHRQVCCAKVVCVRDTLCRTVWMQAFQESKGQYGWTESSTFLVLPKAGFSTCSFRHAIGTGHVFCLLNISGSGHGLTEFTIYSDSSFAPAGRESQTRLSIHLSYGTVRRMIPWQSFKEAKMAESSAESELYALSSAYLSIYGETIRQEVERQSAILTYVSTEKQLANPLTKPTTSSINARIYCIPCAV